ncbi:EpsG family protein [Atopobacter phocae]|uniref:EpsG family protein n=1 Tax=Atopobacter phocae TaxID=136492 RepID=UPI000471391F|nr:EpsG family protein [Atopobacter phocae]
MNKYKERINKSIAIICSLLMWGLMSFNRMNPDWNNYNNIYLDRDDFNRRINELGFFWVTRIGRVINLEYSIFFTIVTTLCLFSLVLLAFKLTTKPMLPLLFYSIFPFMLDIVQFRNFISMTIISWALYCLFNRKKDISYDLLSLSLILIAGTIHNTAFVYVIFWFLAHLKEVYVAILSLTGFITVTFFLKTFDFNGFLNHPILSRYYYLVKGTISLTGQIFFVFNAILMLLLVYWITKAIEKSTLSNNSTNHCYFESDLRKFAWIHIALLPLFFMSVDFYRIIRNILFLFYILFSYYLSYNWGKIKYESEKWLISSGIFAFIACNAYVLLWYSNYENVIRVIFDENKLLNWIFK